MPPAPPDLLPWAAGPAALYLAANAVAPWLARWAGTDPLGAVKWWQRSHLGQLLLMLLQFGFYVGIPYAALTTGAMDLRSLGLAGADTPVTVALAGLVAAASLALFGVAKGYWARGAAATDAPAVPAPSQPGWQALIDAAAIAVALQAHLALYRAAVLPASGADLAPFIALAMLSGERAGGAILAGRWQHAGAARADVEALATVAAGGIVLWGANSLPGAVAVQTAVTFGLSRLHPH